MGDPRARLGPGQVEATSAEAISARLHRESKGSRCTVTMGWSGERPGLRVDGRSSVHHSPASVTWGLPVSAPSLLFAAGAVATTSEPGSVSSSEHVHLLAAVLL